MNTFAELQSREIESARAKNKPINSAHEGYSVILEELDEFWEEVRKKARNRNRDKAVAELIQIAAMAQRTAEDVFMSSGEPPVVAGIGDAGR
jgi:vacuolar-type H+-ATPase catalytic subunit A/Vma1